MIIELRKVIENFHNIREWSWNGITINHDRPCIDRLWTHQDGIRVCLHKIYPLDDSDKPFMHSHPWPCAIHIMKGNYRMFVGYSESLNPPPVVSEFKMVEDSEYSMIDKNMWHAVRPIDEPVYSIMVIGKKWDREMSKPHIYPKILDEQEKNKLIDEFELIHLGGFLSLDR